MQRWTPKRLLLPIIDINSDSSNKDCSIVYSVLGSSVTQTGGQYCPPMHSLAKFVVKKEPSETEAPC